MKAEMNKENTGAKRKRELMRIGIATDFGWFDLKSKLIAALNAAGYEITDIGAYELVTGRNYPDFLIPLAKAVSDGNDKQNQTQFGNGIEACAAVNKIPGVCAVVITEPDISEVEDEDLYVRCLGGQIKGYALSNKKVMTFLNADCSTTVPSNQLLAKVRALKRENKTTERGVYSARSREYNSAMEKF